MAVKQIIHSALFRSGMFGLARRIRRSEYLGATVLLYHHVLPEDAPSDHHAALMGDPTAPQLEAFIAYLKRSFRLTTPGECLDRWRSGREIDPFSLILTFDDGYADLYHR